MLKKVYFSFVACFIVSGWLLLAYYHDTALPGAVNQQEMIRFHVIANSDSQEDQRVKLKVRDAIISYLGLYLKDVTDAAIARQIINENQNEIVAVANKVLAENGMKYEVRMEIGVFEFPVKSYGNITLPAGKYEAVRVLLGKAEGKNWWCVLFPPLCFIDMTNATAVPNSVVDDSQQVTSNSDIQFKFKIAELLSGDKTN